MVQQGDFYVASAGPGGLPQRGGDLEANAKPCECLEGTHSSRGQDMEGQGSFGSLSSGLLVKTLARPFRAQRELQWYCLFFLIK